MRLSVEGEITRASAETFVRRVQACKDGEITVLVDSKGGLLDGAVKMGEALRRFKGDSKVLLLRADSAALFVAVGADTIVCARDGAAVLHGATINVPRSANLSPAALRIAAEATEQMERYACRLLQAKTGAPEGYWRLRMAENKTLTAEELARERLVDEISAWPKRHLRYQFYEAGLDTAPVAMIAAFFERHMPEIEAAVTSGRRAKPSTAPPSAPSASRTARQRASSR